MFAVEVHREHLDLIRIPAEVEPGSHPQLEGSAVRLAAHPFPAVPDRQPLEPILGAIPRAVPRVAV
jgi:hypothetical protein